MTPVFFSVSVRKFAALSVFTFGIYPVYWCYENWKRIRDGQSPRKGAPRGGKRIVPLWRASFAPFYGVSLLNDIKERAEFDQVPVGWNPLLLGLAFCGLALAAFLPAPWSLLSVAIFIPLLPAVATCNAVNAAAFGPEDANDEYSGANIATMVAGALVWVLVVLGVMLSSSATP